jgi:hypothetical protein
MISAYLMYRSVCEQICAIRQAWGIAVVIGRPILR